MGLPGFFAWILKKFAKEILHDIISKKVDYLYIDANCLFHPKCFETLSENQYDELKELQKKMFKNIVDFLDYLEKYVSPTTKMYIAVDGTAPMAKIIQQRKRRYKTELDTFMKNEIKMKYGISILNEWSNTSITPGTEFMEDLHTYLLNHYSSKENKIGYIYSSYHTPGEGEHKILQHIKKNTNIDDTIVIYGLDADLIFLAMASNRPNIYLLREQTLFQKNRPFNNHESSNEKNIFDMTYVSINETRKAYNKEIRYMLGNYMRKELDHIDFSNDLIFICFLLGNDFLPHFPSIDIHTEGLDELIDSYLKALLQVNCPLIERTVNDVGETENVNINMDLFTLMIYDMGEKEEEYFTYKINSSIERHKRRKCYEDEEYKQEIWKMDNLKDKNVDDKLRLGVDNKDIWKYRYYQYHYKLSGSQKEFVDSLSEMYLTGIKWMTEYYFKECPDWKWNYMCHYAPFISDVAQYVKEQNFDLNTIKIEKNGHIPMMAQLISVLPPSCKNYLPESYRSLVTEFESPIIDMFPSRIQLDMLYKNQLYQCVPLIPYLDIDRVIEATNNIKMTKKEKERASIKKDFVF